MRLVKLLMSDIIAGGLEPVKKRMPEAGGPASFKLPTPRTGSPNYGWVEKNNANHI